MGIIRDSFVIFKNWDDAIRTAPEDKQLELYHALMDYAKLGSIPESISWEATMFLTTLQENMEKTISRYSASVKNGRLGGRPSHSIVQKTKITQQNPDKPSITQHNQGEPTPNLNVNDNIKKEINKEKNNTILADSELLFLIEKNFADKDICQKFKEYADMRKAMGKNKAIRTKATFESCVSKLKNFSKNKQQALDVLDYSIANCYQGLFDIFKDRKKIAKVEEIPYAN